MRLIRVRASGGTRGRPAHARAEVTRLIARCRSGGNPVELHFEADPVADHVLGYTATAPRRSCCWGLARTAAPAMRLAADGSRLSVNEAVADVRDGTVEGAAVLDIADRSDSP